jgi:RimJ/RimL family protein N-acetyltransferase
MISYEGKKIKLRPLKASDIEQSVVWRNDPEIRDHFLGIRFPITLEMETAWFESALNDRSNSRVIFAIETIDQAELTGFVFLKNIDWISRLSWFGIMIGEKQYQGKGIGKEAMIILFRYAFKMLNLRKICLEVAAYNAPAIHLYTKLGFCEEGRLKEHIFMNGKYHDLLIMSLFQKDSLP